MTMGAVALPEMKKLKYDPALSTGVVAAGGTLGVLIPPSTVMVIYGILTEQNIAKLFMAGVIPGLVDSAAFDDVFELLAWNQGIGYFSSEIGPSTLFKAYKTIKQQEKLGKDREEIKAFLMANFGEKNPDIAVQ